MFELFLGIWAYEHECKLNTETRDLMADYGLFTPFEAEQNSLAVFHLLDL